MMTVTCKGYRAIHKADGIVLEIEEPVPGDLLPRLIKQTDAAKRLAVSINHLTLLAKQAGIRPVAEKPVRYRESDLLKLTLSAGEHLPVMPAIVPMPTPGQKPVATASLPTRAPVAATAPLRKVKLHL